MYIQHISTNKLNPEAGEVSLTKDRAGWRHVDNLRLRGESNAWLLSVKVRLHSISNPRVDWSRTCF